MTQEIQTIREGTIKDRIKKVLLKHKVYSFMPVQMGYGAAGLDFHCVILVRDQPLPFFIEAKRPGKEPRPRQADLRKNLRDNYNCKVWVIDDDKGIAELEVWLYNITKQKAGVG